MKKLLFFILAMITAFTFVGCGGGGNDARRNLSDAEFTKASLSATDKFGREMSPKAFKSGKDVYVGLFYWMWISNTNYYYHDIFDCTKLMSTEEGEAAFWNIDPNKYQSLSQNGAFHFTNEPLLGYYNSSDPWVITRHMEMFILAEIDFIFLDTSNSLIYDWDVTDNSRFNGTVKSPCYTLLDTMLDLYNKGWDVPKVVFLTNTNSGDRVEEIRTHYYEYQDGKYDPLWFRPDGDRPMIIGTTENNNGASDAWGTTDRWKAISAANQLYFDVKETQWPNKAYKPNGFPWITNRAPQQLHTESQAISVSVAQHDNTYFTERHPKSSRGYDYTSDKICEDWEKGQNFENQWNTVFDLEERGNAIRFINVTGWNEWVGMKFTTLMSYGTMVDNFYGQYTRDLEPDKTLYQDTTLLQLASNIRKLKYEEITQKYNWKKKTITDFADFDDVPAVYLDLKGDTANRDYWSFDVKRSGPYYTDNSGRNDITEIRTVHDDENLYFRVTTDKPIEAYSSGENWMNILINTGSAEGFYGYDYIVNRSPDGNKTSVDKSTGGWNWTNSGEAQLKVEGNQMMVTIPLSALGLSKGNVHFSFKVADNVVKPSWFSETDAEHDILHYYVTGDSAPMGRYNYTYGY